MRRVSSQRLIERSLLTVVATLVVLGCGGCRAPGTTTPEDTLTPAPTAALEPTDTPVGKSANGQTPTATAGATPTVDGGMEAESASEGGAIPPLLDDIRLGIGVVDAETVAFFNAYAREDDVISARAAVRDLLAEVETGQKMLNFNPRDEASIADARSIISEAQGQGITILGYNLETVLDRDELIRKEMEMQSLAQEHDLVYAFGPTIVKLDRHYDDFAQHADVLVLQSQRFQMTEEYEGRVEELIDRIKRVRPEVQVWVVVSCNPPEQPGVTADDIIGDMELIADKADLIWIYFGPRTAPVMEEVFKRLRQ